MTTLTLPACGNARPDYTATVPDAHIVRVADMDRDDSIAGLDDGCFAELYIGRLRLCLLAEEAKEAGVLVHADLDDDDDAHVVIRPEGGSAAETDVAISVDRLAGELMARDSDGDWPWEGTLSAYLAKRAATANGS